MSCPQDQRRGQQRHAAPARGGFSLVELPLRAGTARIPNPLRRRYWPNPPRTVDPFGLAWRFPAASPHQAGEQVIQRHTDDGGGLVAHGIGQDQLATVEEGAAAVDHVGYVAFPGIALG